MTIRAGPLFLLGCLAMAGGICTYRLGGGWAVGLYVSLLALAAVWSEIGPD